MTIHLVGGVRRKCPYVVYIWPNSTTAEGVSLNILVSVSQVLGSKALAVS